MYWMVLRFALQLLVCESVWCVILKPRKGLAWRAPVGIILYCGACIGWRALYLMIPYRNEFLSMLYYLVIFAFTFAVMALCFKVNVRDFITVGVGGYATEHIVFCIATAVKYFVMQGVEQENVIIDHIFYRILPYFVGAALMYWFVIRPAKKNGEFGYRSKKNVIISLLIIFACVFLSTFIGMRTFVAAVICKMYGVLCASFGIVLLLKNSREEKAEEERKTMEKMLRLETMHHEMNKETIDLINIKCHDLNRQLANLAKMSDAKERESALNEIKDAVMIYGNTVKTGNAALDVVIAEKVLICESKKILFSCIADGKKLDFMRADDIYSLFGNALDNAIESVCGEENEEHRLISMSVRNRNEILLVHIDNYCSEEIQFENGLPVTTKDDKDYHGFGTRSMQYVAAKYGGEINFYYRDNRFNADIMFNL